MKTPGLHADEVVERLKVGVQRVERVVVTLGQHVEFDGLLRRNHEVREHVGYAASAAFPLVVLRF